MSTTLTSPAGTSEDRGAVLMGTSLAFGITSTLIAMLRIGYRLATRTTKTSDTCIAVAMVSPSASLWHFEGVISKLG
jgi:hypothetical protein